MTAVILVAHGGDCIGNSDGSAVAASTKIRVMVEAATTTMCRQQQR